MWMAKKAPFTGLKIHSMLAGRYDLEVPVHRPR